YHYCGFLIFGTRWSGSRTKRTCAVAAIANAACVYICSMSALALLHVLPNRSLVVELQIKLISELVARTKRYDELVSASRPI
ncbi:MAG: hypothetical protein AAGL92_12330, partial [Pseudomonadota bacterium]